MENFLKETPAKVFSLLAVSMVSLGFLLAVSSANASFSGVEIPLPQPPISADSAMALLDHVAAGYASFMHENLLGPAHDAVAFHVESAKAAFDDATDELALYMPVSSPAPQAQLAADSAKPQVAGAYTEASQGVFSVIFKVLQ